MRFKQNDQIVDPSFEAFDYLKNKPTTTASFEIIDLDDLRKSNKNEYNYILFKESHCSAIIKLTRDSSNNIEDVFLGHSTFDDFREMVRIWK